MFSSVFSQGGMLNNMFDLDGMRERQEQSAEGTLVELDTFRSSSSSTPNPSSASTPNPSPSPPNPFYLIIYNISKKNNVNSLVNAALSFGCSMIFVVGQRNLPVHVLEGVPHRRFDDLGDCVEYCKGTLGADVVGVEIMEVRVVRRDSEEGCNE